MQDQAPEDMAKVGLQADDTASAEPPPLGHVSPRKAKRSPQKVRKSQASSDPAGQILVNGENYSYGDPRVEPLSQLSDIVTMDEPATVAKCVNLPSRKPASMSDVEEIVDPFLSVMPWSFSVLSTCTLVRQLQPLTEPGSSDHEISMGMSCYDACGCASQLWIAGTVFTMLRLYPRSTSVQG